MCTTTDRTTSGSASTTARLRIYTSSNMASPLTRRLKLENSHKIVAVILLAYLVGVFFDLLPGDGPQYSFFPFYHGQQGWDGKMTLQNYVYGYCEHCFTILIFYAVYLHTGRNFWSYLMWLEVGAVVDYALTYNSTLFTVGEFEVEYNALRFPLVLYLTIYEYGNSDT